MKTSWFLLGLEPQDDGFPDHLGDLPALGSNLHPLKQFSRDVDICSFEV